MSVASKTSALSGASLSVLAALVTATPAAAQPVQLGPVTVQDQTDKNALNHAPPVSTMPSTSLQDTPQAVTVVSGETMRQQATTTLGDAHYESIRVGIKFLLHGGHARVVLQRLAADRKQAKRSILARGGDLFPCGHRRNSTA